MYPFVVTIVYPVRTAASQAVKTGSNPVGDAKLNQALADICCEGLLFFGPCLAERLFWPYRLYTKDGGKPLDGQIFRQVSDQFRLTQTDEEKFFCK